MKGLLPKKVKKKSVLRKEGLVSNGASALNKRVAEEENVSNDETGKQKKKSVTTNSNGIPFNTTRKSSIEPDKKIKEMETEKVEIEIKIRKVELQEKILNLKLREKELEKMNREILIQKGQLKEILEKKAASRNNRKLSSFNFILGGGRFLHQPYGFMP